MLKLGIQGNFGSMNEVAAKHFIRINNWADVEIVPLVTSKAVVAGLKQGSIDYGTFAYSSSKAGLVEETQRALVGAEIEKVAEVILPIQHALLFNSCINSDQQLFIYSHPQALKEHEDFLRESFSNLHLVPTEDTASAAKNLKAGKYEKNSLVIAPRHCAELYQLSCYLEVLPSNHGYFTTFWLVRAIH